MDGHGSLNRERKQLQNLVCIIRCKAVHPRELSYSAWAWSSHAEARSASRSASASMRSLCPPTTSATVRSARDPASDTARVSVRREPARFQRWVGCEGRSLLSAIGAAGSGLREDM